MEELWRICLTLPAQHLNLRGAPDAKAGEVRSEVLQELSRQNSSQVSLQETVGTEAVLMSRLPLDKLSNLTSDNYETLQPLQCHFLKLILALVNC